MSVTRRPYFFSSRLDSEISCASRSSTFLFHMPRSSIHFMPNSAATPQARSKSWLISSLMTPMRKGEWVRSVARESCGKALAIAVVPIVLRKARRESGYITEPRNLTTREGSCDGTEREIVPAHIQQARIGEEAESYKLRARSYSPVTYLHP